MPSPTHLKYLMMYRDAGDTECDCRRKTTFDNNHCDEFCCYRLSKTGVGMVKFIKEKSEALFLPSLFSPHSSNSHTKWTICQDSYSYKLFKDLWDSSHRPILRVKTRRILLFSLLFNLPYTNKEFF